MDRVCTPAEREVLRLFSEGESLESIAGRLGLKSATVRSHCRRGKVKLLAYLVGEEPELVGGEAAIRQAKAAARSSSEEGDRLSREEAEALRQPRGHTATFRRACVKLAKYLPL